MLLVWNSLLTIMGLERFMTGQGRIGRANAGPAYRLVHASHRQHLLADRHSPGTAFGMIASSHGLCLGAAAHVTLPAYYE